MKNIIMIIKKLIGKNKYKKLKYLFIFLVQKIGFEKKILKIIFNKKLGYKLDFSENPKTFNQKIQFRKIFDRNPLYTLCADKYRVREYVKEKIGEEYLIPLYLVTEKLSKEQWEKLPNQFVAKANNNSGPVQIVTDKINTSYEKLSKELHRQLTEKYGTLSMESYYDDIKPLIIAEEFLDFNGKPPEDYKFHCFNKNGEFKCFIQHVKDRSKEDTDLPSKYNFYDEEWNLLDLEMGQNASYIGKEAAPEKLNKMILLARKLSEDFKYVRVDFYNLEEKIFFGELTFCHAGGFKDFSPREWDYEWGRYWDQKLTGKK